MAMEKESEHSPSGRRLHAYRPVLDRLIFAVGLLGLLVVVHLWIQQGRGFDRGCLGFSQPTPAATVDCNAVVQSRAGTLLGVSNVVWGALFYLGVIGLSLIAAYSEGQWQRRLKQTRALLVTGGFCYMLYLLYYQSFVMGSYCVLCLISAGIVAILFGLHLIDFFTDPDAETMSFEKQPASRGREVVMLSLSALLVFVLAGADVLYFRSLDDPQPQATATPSSNMTEGEAAQTPNVQRACQYDPETEPVDNFESLVQFDDPAKGNANAAVTVIEYLDPTCPHCKTLHNQMGSVIEEQKERARFVYKLFPLREASLPPILALEVAAKKNKFFEMLDRQFAVQDQGFTMERLRKMAQQLGMDPNKMERQMKQESLVQNVLEERRRAVEIGISSTPTVIINGRFVNNTARTPECLNQLIEEAAQEASGTEG